MDGALDKSGGQTENDLEQGFVKHWLNSVSITGPLCLDLICLCVLYFLIYFLMRTRAKSH